MTAANYACTQPILADTSRLAWLLCQQHLANFTDYKSKYNQAFINENLAFILAFTELDNRKSLKDAIQQARKLYLDEKEGVFELFKFLKGYINDVAEDKVKRETLYKDAGQSLYNNLSPNNWKDLDGLLSAMVTFVQTHQTDLAEKGGMTANFSDRLATKTTALATAYQAWLAEDKTASKAADEKIIAGNNLKVKVMAMLADAQVVFNNDKITAKKFVWDTILVQIRGVKETGISGKIFLKGSKKPLANVQISIPALGLTTTTNEDGRYEIIPLEAGDYTFEIKAEGYQTIVIDNRTLKSGVIGRLNFELEAIVA